MERKVSVRVKPLLVLWGIKVIIAGFALPAVVALSAPPQDGDSGSLLVAIDLKEASVLHLPCVNYIARNRQFAKDFYAVAYLAPQHGWATASRCDWMGRLWDDVATFYTGHRFYQSTGAAR
jgi:hypothetical protein